MNPIVLVVLVHSPLVGPSTWSRLLPALEARRIEAIAPSIRTDSATRPYWRQHVEAVVRAIREYPVDRPVVLVGHSGAGVLLPAIREALGPRPIAGYVFVDAIVPRHLASRLDLFDTPEAATAFRNSARDGWLPVWTEERLRAAIPDDETRRQFVEELRPLPLEVYEEPIPVFTGWPDAPCAYLHFSSAYAVDAERARRASCAYRHTPGGHFQMLSTPEKVADDLGPLLRMMIR